MMRLYCLGTIRVVHDTLGEMSLRRRKPLGLLAYLALEAGGAHSRERLTGLFWPHLSTKAAQNNLRVTLTRLSKELGQTDVSYLLNEQNTVQLNPDAPLWLDAAAFTELIESTRRHEHASRAQCQTCVAALTRAAALYNGEFLQDFYLQNCTAFEEWQYTEREHYHLAATQVFADLSDYYEQVVNYALAEQYTRRQLGLEPYSEAAQRRLMRLLTVQDKRNEALEAFGGFAARLKRDLEVEPEDETVLLYQQIQTGKLAAPHVVTPFHATVAEHNLPADRTPFVGREEELGQLTRHLHKQRLVTLLGVGGVGKSRLALALARAQLGTFKDGVYLLRLAALQDPSLLADRLAETLGLELHSGADARTGLLTYLKDRSLLLVLDNFEHLLEGRGLVAEILQAAPEVKMLVTSRQKLALSSEAVFKVRGLSYPRFFGQGEEAAESGDLGAYSACRLFLDTAARVKLGFDPQPGDLPEVVRICRLVEGHPLATVLAASWLESLSCREVANELEQGYDLLETQWHDVPERHSSIQAVFEYSWQRLSGEEQTLLSRMAMFRGGFNRNAAKAVAGASLSHLNALVSKSLVQRDDTRYDLHELMRQFISQRLPVETEDHARYADFYLALLHTQKDALIGPEPLKVVETLQPDVDNIRAAWQWALERRDPKRLKRGLTGLARFYEVTSRYQEGLECFEQTLVLCNGVADDEARDDLCMGLHLESAPLACRLGQFEEALAHLAQAVPIALRRRDSYAHCRARYLEAEVYLIRGLENEVFRLAEPLLERVRSEGFKNLEAQCLRLSGVGQDDYEVALEYLEGSARLQRALGNPAEEQRVLINLAREASLHHDYRRWQDYVAQARRLSERLGHKRNTCLILNLTGRFLTDTGQFARAVETYLKARTLCREIGERVLESYSCHNLCFAYTVLGELEAALEHGHAALRLASECQSLEVTQLARSHLAYAQLAAGNLASAARGFRQACEGWTALDRAPLVTENLAGLANVCWQEGDRSQALTYVGNVLEGIEQDGLGGVDVPMRIYLTCYRILRDCDDDRAAEVLKQAQKFLQERATMIDDTALRHSYLNDMPFNLAIIKAVPSRS